MKITDIIMDFDGTCTQIPAIYEAFLAQYLLELNKTVFAGNPAMASDWWEAQQLVRQHSPKAGWTLATTPSAPAAADPYILASECANYLLQKKNIPKTVPAEAFSNAAALYPAPWRNEARSVFETLLQHNIGITFISNTSSATITERLKTLFSSDKLPAGIFVKSGAAKYNISELPWYSAIPQDNVELYEQLPVVALNTPIGRPVYLRRGNYFAAICDAFNNDLKRLSTAVFCGDIWEMDLAMPYTLGANIHLIERAKPFDTYEYERKAVLENSRRGKISKDLTGLLEWVK